MPPDRQRQDQGPRNSSWQGAKCTPVVMRSLEHQADDSTIYLDSTPILRENTLGEGPPTSLPLPPTLREDLRVDGCLKYPHAAREGTIHLQKSMSSSGFEPSSNGTAVSIVNHYTGWAIREGLNYTLCRKKIYAP
ncbi:hypothetical protein TNCV_828811 [Trichonephila clavipes]|nr:hypothetical protein TNCV_828811 [Trichonephila clavipes]